MRRFSGVLRGVALLALWSVSAAAQTAPPDGPAAPAAPAEDESPLAVEAGGLTADQVAARALVVSTGVRAREADVDVAEARIDQAGVAYVPRVVLRASYTRLSPVESGFGSGALVGAQNPGLLTTGACPGGAGTCVLDSAGQPVGAAPFTLETVDDNYAVGASATVPLSDYVLKLSHSSAAASASRRSAALARDAEKLMVQSHARLLYYRWVRLKGRLLIAQKALARTQARLRDADSQLAAEVITRADHLRLQALVANTELLVEDADTAREISERHLGAVMGETQAKSFGIGEDVRGVASPKLGSLDAMVAEAVQRRLEVRSLSEASSAQRRGARALGAGALPHVDAVGDVTYANPNPRYFPQQAKWNATWSVGVQASWAFGDVLAGSAAADEAEARARSLDAQRRAALEGIRQEVTEAWLSGRRARVAIKTSRRALEAATEAYRVATDLYQAGKSTTSELIDAESDLLTARLTELDARVELKMSEERLRHATGSDVSGR